ncbi:MAG: chemotaxis protein CheA [Desulfuromonadales bacterium]|nr:chemotaxis protein CheA [Desulfuromonadales bacterium]NIR33985.1 chemotaxis protein CheA [Desulfuromonadales bacterium]NIS42657.1 chemotaxis protein CheA [Desulfuromonadales bacterium]
MGDKASPTAIKEFLGEAEEILEKLNLDLVELGERADSGESDPDLLNSIFRGAHSIKGLAGMFGFDDISDLAHHMESLLDSLRLGKVPLNEVLVETLFDALETLTRIIHGKGEREDYTLDFGSLVARIDSLLGGGGGSDKTELLKQVDAELVSVLTEFEEHRLLENLKKGHYLYRVKASFDLARFDQDLADLTAALKREGEVISTLPSVDDDMTGGIAFQLLVGTAAAKEKIAETAGRPVEIETLVDATTSAPAAPGGLPSPAEEPVGDDVDEQATLRSISRTVRVDIEKLDVLMNIVGELVLCKAAISENCESLKEAGNVEMVSDLQKATRNLERRLEELQKGVMEVRMVPVSQLFDKMARIVRRVAGEYEKKVALDIRGADTELDKLIVEELSDPLMHIIRNAIDHGIESASDRREAGKPEKGTISLWASQKGNHVVLEIHDDGRGIDIDKVRRRAVERGLISADTDVTRDKLMELIFQPGFSTRDEVSELSGRGVGMDVVKNNIAALSGMIEVDSRLGEGTSMTITLPITLAIIKALIVEICNKTYAVPINSVMETLMVNAEDIRTIERREVYELRDSTLPLIRLEEIFDLPRSGERPERFYIVVVGLADKKIGIIVDELLGQQDVVIKSFGEALSFVRGFAGAADLGNQKTVLVLDVGGLIGDALKGEAA